MYISVDSYYDMYLKDKSLDVVNSEVQKLRSEIERLKRKMESPAYAYESDVSVSGLEVVGIYRGYLKAALAELAKKQGVSSVLTEEEKRAMIIDSMLPDMTVLTLTVGCYLQYKYRLSVTESTATVTSSVLGGEAHTREVDRDKILSELSELHLGEWRDVYSPEQYGCTLSDPEKWQLRIEYNNGSAPYFSDGVGIYPYNFDELCRILEVDVI
ncbi:MAG: hypothetical protein E7617_04605 [Ruminococcaceae bacterium]|nr:hypothetical protein [Oscillospiraceae bacterium]